MQSAPWKSQLSRYVASKPQSLAQFIVRLQGLIPNPKSLG